MLSCFSPVQLFETLWTVALQAPLSMRFSRQEYWSGLPFPSPEDLDGLAYKEQKFTSHRSWEWKFKICTSVAGSGESPLLHCRWLTFHIFTWQKKKKKGWEISPGYFYKGTYFIFEAPYSWPDYLPKAPPPTTITLGVIISTSEFWVDTYMQSIALVKKRLLSEFLLFLKLCWFF